MRVLSKYPDLCWMVFFLSWLLVSASWMPPIQDEVYYATWSQHLAWGYLDHPPGVAVLAALGGFLQGLVSRSLQIRLGTILVAALTWFEWRRLAQAVGLRDRGTQAIGLLLAQGSIAGIACGLITTPDNILAWTWVAALRQAYLALQGDRRRWLWCGAVIGFGLLSKYTMILMGPVCLVALWHQDREALRTPWPYAGAALAVAIFLPNVLWNQQNQWATFDFQLRHGVGVSPSADLAALLPAPQSPGIGSQEMRMAKELDLLEKQALGPKQQEIRPKRGPRSWATKTFLQVRDYWVGEVMLWGLLLVPLVWGWWHWRRKPMARNLVSYAMDHTGDSASAPEQDESQLTWWQWVRKDDLCLLRAAVWVPLAFFMVFAVKSKVEANWAAMYLLGAAVLFAPLLRPVARMVAWATAGNLLLITFAVVHTVVPFLPVRPEADRLLHETHGYAALASFLRSRTMATLADSYQLVSMARIHEPGFEVFQWPGITRPSEWTRRRDWRMPEEVWKHAEMVQLVTCDDVPPHFAGWEVEEMIRWRDCGGRAPDLLEIRVDQTARMRTSQPVCAEPVHQWHIVTLRRSAEIGRIP